MAKHANFTYKYVTPSDRQWGRKLENGAWTGMIGKVVLNKKQLDIALHFLKIFDF